jgi:basic amino acid/polyamine antiporter, APA family
VAGSRSSGPLLEVVEIGAPALQTSEIFSAISMIAVSNTMLINMMMASRLLYGMARRGVLPGAVARVSPRQTPWVAIVVTTALSVLLLLTVEELSDLSATTVLLLVGVFFLVNVSALVLRRDRVGHPHFRAPVVALVLGAAISLVFLLPVGRETGIYLLAVWLLLGGLVLAAVNWLAVRRA